MVQKSYHRYALEYVAGVVASDGCHAVECLTILDPPNTASWSGNRMGGRGGAAGQAQQETDRTRAVCVVAALNAVSFINARTGTVETRLTSKTAAKPQLLDVSALRCCRAKSGYGLAVAVGYSNGYLSLFRFAQVRQVDAGPGGNRDPMASHRSQENFVCIDMRQWEEEFHSLGHRADTKVLSLDFSRDGLLLCSGGQDTDVTVWDVTSHEALFRLRGHRGAIVGLRLLGPSAQYLLSAGHDGLLKVWDVGVKSSIQTLVASDSQITCLAVDPGEMRAFIGLRDAFVKVFDLTPLQASTQGEIKAFGELPRKSNKPAIGMAFTWNHRVLAVLGSSDRSVELFGVLTAEDVKKKVARKKKRRKEAAGDEDKAQEDGAAAKADDFQPTCNEEIVPLRIFHLDSKVQAAAFDQRSALVTPTRDNTLQMYKLFTDEGEIGDQSLLRTIENQGHRGEVTRILFSHDCTVIATLSSESLKLWKASKRAVFGTAADGIEGSREAPMDASEVEIRDLVCSGTVELPAPGKCMVYAPGDIFIVVGCEDGSLLICNSAACTISSKVIGAHGASSLVALSLLPDKSGCVSVGLDKQAVFWQFQLTDDESSVLCGRLRDVELVDVPTAVEVSEDDRFLLVGLQNFSVHVLYLDTLKPFLSLYGHKLPVTAIAVSSDSQLVATSSLDKNIRLWGLDFGDCHRAIRAHDDYVTCVRFILGSHHLISSSRDGTVKHWDGDTWELIQVLRVHNGPIWWLALTGFGSYLATCGADRRICLHVRTEEIVFPEEEREREAQEAMDTEAAKKMCSFLHEEKEAEAGLAGQGTVATAEAAERLMECLDLISIENQRQEARAADSQKHPVFRNRSTSQYLWEVLSSIKYSEVRHAVTVLTSVHSHALIREMDKLLDTVQVNYEVLGRIVLALTRPRSGYSLNAVSDAGQAERRVLQTLRQKLYSGLEKEVDRMGFNNAGLQILRNTMLLEQQQRQLFFDRSKIQGAKRKTVRSRLRQEHLMSIHETKAAQQK
jgi:U3 small nucleolar RNA-associated protein 12